MHDVLDPRDLVPDEADQLAVSGYEIGSLGDDARAAAADGDLDRLSWIEQELAVLVRDRAWLEREPEDEQALRELAGAADVLPVDPASLHSRIRGAWLGRTVGNTLGKPVEGLTRAEVETYLRAAGQWPQVDYLPLLNPVPDGVRRLHASAPISTAGNFIDVPRDDDIDWTILNLSVLEARGPSVTTEDMAAAWLDRIPFTQTYTAERAAYRNLTLGLAPPATATHRNPYREWIGALIRGDVFGLVHPGRPGAAAALALTDARLSHVANGVYGEMWAAALVAAALGTSSIDEAYARARGVVPPRSRLAAVVREVRALRDAGVSWSEALDWVDAHLGHYSWVHTLSNAAIISIALLWGDGFTEATAISVAGGRDTDSTTATVGSVIGALHGDAAVPQHLVGTTHVRVRSAIWDFDRITIDELAERTATLVPKFAGPV